MSTSAPSSTATAVSSSPNKPSATLYVFTFVATVAILFVICVGFFTRSFVYRRRLRCHLLSLNISAADREEVLHANGAQLRAIANILNDAGLTSDGLGSRHFLGISNTPLASNQRRRSKKDVVLGRVPDLWEVTTGEDQLYLKCDTAAFDWKDLRPISLSVSTKSDELSEQATPVLTPPRAPSVLQNLFSDYSSSEPINPLVVAAPLGTSSSASSVVDRVSGDSGSRNMYLSVLIKMPEDAQMVSARAEEQESDLDEDERGLYEMGDIELGVAMVHIG